MTIDFDTFILNHVSTQQSLLKPWYSTEDGYQKEMILDGQAVKFDILDTAGQDEYSALRHQWVQDAQGFLIVYSVEMKNSYDEAKELLQFIYDTKGTKDVPMYVSTQVLLFAACCCLFFDFGWLLHNQAHLLS